MPSGNSVSVRRQQPTPEQQRPGGINSNQKQRRFNDYFALLVDASPHFQPQFPTNIPGVRNQILPANAADIQSLRISMR
jgi:hypothetical protein